jgi:hypothetical protein
MRWYALRLEEGPQGQRLLGQDQAPHPTREEVEEGVEPQPRSAVMAFPQYTPQENPQEGTWKALKEAVSHHQWQEAMADLRAAIDRSYQAGQKHMVNFLQKVGYRWGDGIIEPLPQTG